MAQAMDNEERRNGLVRANMDANERELNFHASDKFLNENSASHFNNRVIRDAYKGSSRLERVQVAAEQQQQRLQKESTKTAEKYDDRYCGNTSMETTRRQLVAMER